MGTPGSGAGGVGGAGVGGAEEALVKQWARDVTLGTEFGGDGDVVVRWTTSPTLSVMTGSEADRVNLLELVPELSALTAPLSIEVVPDADDSADIKVYFAPLAEFDGIAEANGFPYVPGNYGYFYMFWDDGNALTETFVMLATDELDPAELRHFTFEEVTQAMGFATDSAIFADSIFFADGTDGGSASELGVLDQRLVTFSYTHLSPGDDASDFDAAFDAHFFE